MRMYTGCDALNQHVLFSHAPQFLTGQESSISTFLTTTSLLRIFAKAMPTHMSKGKTIVSSFGVLALIAQVQFVPSPSQQRTTD